MAVEKEYCFEIAPHYGYFSSYFISVSKESRTELARSFEAQREKIVSIAPAQARTVIVIGVLYNRDIPLGEPRIGKDIS